MKKLISIITVLTISLTVMSQPTTLNKNLSIQDGVDIIEVYDACDFRYYSTSSGFYEFNVYDNICEADGYIGSQINDVCVNGNELKVVRNDTLSVSFADGDYYYGVGDFVTNDNGNYNMDMNVKSITSDGTFIYAIAEYGTDYNIRQINSTTDNVLGTNITTSDLSDYSEIEYFEFGGVSYIAVIYSQFSHLGLYNMDTEQFYQTDVWSNHGSVTSIKESNGDFYFSVANEIYKIDNITNDGSNIATSIEYELSTNADINDFAFNDFGIEISVAATDGIYTTVEEDFTTIEEEIAFEDVKLYPNPNNGNFTLSNIKSGTKVSVINTTGQVIHKQITDNNGNISIELLLPKGMYFVDLSNDTTEKTIKFVTE